MAETADIKRQIVYGDLPESELEEIIRLAIAQRNKKRGIVASAKKELPEDEKLLLQCCTDNRNYNESENADIRICPHCGSVYQQHHAYRSLHHEGVYIRI